MLQFIFFSVDEYISCSQIFTLQIILLGASLSTLPCRHMGYSPQEIDPAVLPYSTFQEVSYLFSKVVVFIYIHSSVLFSPYLCQHPLVLNILIFANLMNLKLHFRVFLCFSVTTVSLNIFQIYFAIYEHDRLFHLFWHIYYIYFLKCYLSSKQVMHAFYRISSKLLSILYIIVNAIGFVKLHILILIAIVRITTDLCMLIICLVILLNSY